MIWRASGSIGAHLERFALALLRWDGDAQHALNRHGVAAGAPIGEETAGAVPLAVVEGCRMGIVLSSESRRELGELDALWFLRVLLGLRDLPDHARVHWSTPLSCLSPNLSAADAVPRPWANRRGGRSERHVYVCFDPHLAWWARATAGTLPPVSSGRHTGYALHTQRHRKDRLPVPISPRARAGIMLRRASPTVYTRIFVSPSNQQGV